MSIILTLILAGALSFPTKASLSKGEEEFRSPFDFSSLLIPRNEILSGGPPKDGIPALTNPKFISGNLARYLHDEDLLIVYKKHNEIRGYSLPILNWHEVVNDTIQGEPILVTYCPLCHSSLIFSREIDGEILEFGVSGYLYQSDVLMYDRKYNGLYSQLLMKAVSGPLSGKSLKLMPSLLVSFKDFKKNFPRGKVLSEDTGYDRDYDRDPYFSYRSSEGTYFPVNAMPPHPKKLVAGFFYKGKPHCFFLKAPFQELLKAVKSVGNLHLRKESGGYSLYEGASKAPIPLIYSYHFAWKSFHASHHCLPSKG